MAKIFGYATPKGGAGKSMLSVLIGGYLQYFKDKDVLLVDGDPQNTNGKLRRKHLKALSKEEAGKVESNSFSLISCAPTDVMDQVEMNKEYYDYIVIDLAGSAAVPGNIRAFAMMDRVIIPFNGLEATTEELYTTVDIFIKEVLPARKELGLGGIKMVGLLNNINGRVGDVRAIMDLRKLERAVIEEGIKAVRKDPEALVDYYLPVKLLGELADINNAPAALGSYITSLRTELTLSIIKNHRLQCEAMLSFINS